MNKKMHATASVWVDENGQKAVRDTESGLRITMVASTASVDRDNESIDVDGWEWNEQALPKLLFGHDYHSVGSVIGKLTKVWKESGRLMVEAELADKVPEAENAKLVAGLMRMGFLDQGSVGFIPKEWDEADGKSAMGRRYTKQELIEFSIVPVPSQRDSVLVGIRSLFDPGPPAPPIPMPVEVEEVAPEPEAKDTRDWFTKMFGPREKAGRVLSRANQDKLANAKDAMTAASAAIEEVLRSAERADQDTVTDDTAR